MRRIRHRRLALALAGVLVAPAAARAGSDPVINEHVFSHTGTDDAEHVEILRDPRSHCSGSSVLLVEGDSGTDERQVSFDIVQQVGTTDAGGSSLPGLFLIDLQSGKATPTLVEGFTGAEGDDLDLDDDGMLGPTPRTRTFDAVAASDGGAANPRQADTVLTPGFDGIGSTAGGASRIPDGTDDGDRHDRHRGDDRGDGHGRGHRHQAPAGPAVPGMWTRALPPRGACVRRAGRREAAPGGVSARRSRPDATRSGAGRHSAGAAFSRRLPPPGRRRHPEPRAEGA